MNEKKDLIEYLQLNKKQARTVLFFDIETLQFNEEEGRKKPSKYKNVTFSVCVGWNEGFEIKRIVFPDFREFFELVMKAYTNKSGKIMSYGHNTIELIAHNNNKYDNHFLLKDLCYYYPHIKRENLFLKNALDNDFTLKQKELTPFQKEGIILEKRLKSSNNLELDFYLYGIHFVTIDNYMKTTMSIKTIGEKLHRKGLIEESELKTSFDYLKWNIPYNLEPDLSRTYARYVFSQLNDEEMIYIENDVIILGKCVLYYDTIFPGFDYKKITFTSNILESYNTNDLTSFQLLNKIGDHRTGQKINYTEFKFNNENFYDYIKPFYRGGLNVYNDKYVGKIIYDYMFSIDINSSYPHAMYHYKLPTFLRNFKEYDKPTMVDIEKNENFYLYRITKDDFNEYVMFWIDSELLRKIITKYYSVSGNSYVNMNSWGLKMIEKVAHIKINKLPVLSMLEYECEYFGSRDQIAEYYFIKTQGKLDKKIIMNSPTDYIITDEENKVLFSEEEIYNAKVMLNGLYGIPALRAYFNMFRTMQDGTLKSYKNGYKNTERNLIFSIAVTSISLYNLLEPLSYLTAKEIDENLIYADTDSLYLKQAIRHKLPDTLFDDIALGKWGFQEKVEKGEKIEKFFALNHKKYCYYKSGKIIVKSGGIDLASFNKKTYFKMFHVKHSKDMKYKKLTIKKSSKLDKEKLGLKVSFEHFIMSQFNHGSTIKNQKSIYNEDGTISIYQSFTQIERGKAYPDLFSHFIEKRQQKIIEIIRENEQEFDNDILFIETPYGTISQSDLQPVKHESNEKYDVSILKIMNLRIKNILC